jgi:hypothetical protein
MPLTGLKLFGSTVKNFSTSIQWGSQKSLVKVSLVQDTTLGDYFLPPPIGSLTYVTFYSLNFWGILQSWRRMASSGGLPTFEVTIEDPRSILEGTEVVLSNYNGSTYNVPNLLNVYGYLEDSLGFGGSQSNEAGIPWTLVKSAIIDLIGGANFTYGQPLSYKGYNYLLDLSEIPSVPPYYRLGGSVNMSLLSIIERVCADSGCDFFIDCQPNSTIIRVRTVSRKLQPPAGYIQQLVDSAILDKITVSSGIGLEAVNQVTSSFLVGGPVQTMYEAPLETIHPYFGKDPNNNPILSWNAQAGNPYSLTVNLNANEVEDILGTNVYQCTSLEMCCALAGQNMWLDYMAAVRPALTTALGIVPPELPPGQNGFANPVMPQDGLNLTPALVLLAAGGLVEDISIWLQQRLFNFVKKAASEYLGKKFLVEIPFMFTAVDEDTGKLITSYEVASNGGYVETGLPPLGLHPVYQNNVTNSEGLFNAYALYSNLVGADLSRLHQEYYTVDLFNGNGIYVNIGVDPEIIFLDELTPCVCITVSNPLYSAPIDATGAGIAEIAAIFQMTEAQASDLFQKMGAGNFFGSIHPLPRQPDTLTVPFKSNILTYGPWYAIGSQGKVNFESDPNMVPWNYGGSDFMNLVANARISESITYQQYAEMGDVELVEPPRYNIGDQLALTGQSLGGPTVSSMQVDYGEGGVKTRYNFQTFTTKFGAFSKDNIERMKKITLAQQQLRRENREVFNKLILKPDLNNELIALLNPVEGSGSIDFWPKQFQRASPHTVLSAVIDADGDNPDLARVSVTTLSDREIAPSIPAHDTDLYTKTACMSLTGLIRPFSTAYTNEWLPSFEEPNSNYSSNTTVSLLNPFKAGNDIELYTYGDTYSDAHAYRDGGPGEAVRGFALRTPLILSGWGWSTDDVFVPQQNPDTLSGGVLTNYLRKSWLWKTGPMDPLWDDERRVWTVHGTMLGLTLTDIGPMSSGQAVVCVPTPLYAPASRKKNRTVYNFMSQTVAANSNIIANWVPDANAWYIVAADCPTV